MSPKNHTNRTTATTTDDRHLHAVPDQQNVAMATEDKVRAALADNPGFTAAELAMAAGVGRSTAAKILARWDRDGHAIRTSGAGPRNPDTWALAPAYATTTPDVDDEQPDATGTAPSTDQGTDDPHSADEAAPGDSATTQVSGPAVEEYPAAEERSTTPETDDNAVPDNAPTSAADDSAPTDGIAAAQLAETLTTSSVDNTTTTESSRDVPAADAASVDTTPPDKGRLRKGGLRALVEEYLTEHPGESFGPAKIGKDLGRSGGAVNNALEKLVADGYALKTCEAPKRFAINPAKTDIPQEARDSA
ncbi:MarR family transcriptional regulator [Amycolatopsis tucumanensis]|uniref:MarR family transcriptional regulator n=1 Tax=Amycolatopsis tucumanensis TaxID=401106 RepID=A0ABP7JQA8_9PSEU|nr:helix-turn-helix domain-containing protein [Amycolatopsis tucumanensis]MCF6424992.1 hypothetical protein [Amycolatopsis tucumanensis]